MNRFTLSRLAEEDLIQIYLDGAQSFGQKQAGLYHQLLSQAFHFLADNPLAGPLRTELTPVVRIHPVGTHIVLYTVRQHDILILRIRHAHEDWLEH